MKTRLLPDGVKYGRQRARNAERRTLLTLVQRIPPDALPRMQEIEELDVLRVAVADALAQRTSG